MQEKGKYKIKFFDPIYPPIYNRETLEQDIAEMTKKYVAYLEQTVREYPEQWFAFQDVFI